MADLVRDGVRLHYDVAGGPGADGAGAGGAARSAGGLPLLLSHGFGATSLMWAPNLPALAAGRRVITWDMRGHGRSDSPRSGYTQRACVADMAALLDACGVSRAVVGGLSLGGYLSLAFRLAHPERVAALLLFDTGPGFRNDTARQAWNDRALATAGRLERDGLAAIGDAAGQHSSPYGLAQAARGMLTQRDGRVIDSLPAIDVPVLVLVGAEDRPFLAAADYIAAKVPGARKSVIPGAGHAANSDQPDLFNQAVLSFLAEACEAAGEAAGEEAG